MSKNILTIAGIIFLTICIVIGIVAISEIHYNTKDDTININNYNMFNSNSTEDAEAEEAIKVSVQSKYKNKNTIFIGDSYGCGGYSCTSAVNDYFNINSDDNNWQAYLATKLSITNYRRYSKDGLGFSKGSPNNLYSFIHSDIIPNETNPDNVEMIIIMLGINDSFREWATPESITNDVIEVINYLKSYFPNAQIYYFYSAPQRIEETASLKYIKKAITQLDINYYFSSYAWGINSDFYTGGPVTHPTNYASHKIADNMYNVFANNSWEK